MVIDADRTRGAQVEPGDAAPIHNVLRVGWIDAGVTSTLTEGETATAVDRAALGAAGRGARWTSGARAINAVAATALMVLPTLLPDGLTLVVGSSHPTEAE